MSRLPDSGKVWSFCGTALAAAGLLVSALAAPASGEERKFVIMLATSPKSVAMLPAGSDPPVLPNTNDIWDAYFDLVKDCRLGKLRQC